MKRLGVRRGDKKRYGENMLYSLEAKKEGSIFERELPKNEVLEGLKREREREREKERGEKRRERKEKQLVWNVYTANQD